MIDKAKLAASFTGQLHNIRTTSDGGGKMTVEFGKDGLKAVQFIQELASLGDVNFEIAMVALPSGQKYAEPHESEDHEDFDGDTGF